MNNKVYEIFITTSFAKCEQLYLSNLIKAIEKSTSSALSIESLNHMKRFNNEFTNKLEDIKTRLTTYFLTFTDQEDLSTLDTNITLCNALRNQFHDLHRDFVSSIDACNEFHIRKHKQDIRYALSVASIYMTDDNLSQPEKIKLKEFHDYITGNLEPLKPKLAMFEEYNNIPLVDYDDMTNESINDFLTNYANKYFDQLADLKSSIINKFNFIFSADLFMETVCNKILDITHAITIEKYASNNSLNKQSIFANTSKDIQQAISFVNKNLDFFSAPFNDSDHFQSWCKDNEKAITPLSDTLSKSLYSKDQLVTFKRALIGQSDTDTHCLRSGNHERIHVFFNHPTNQPLVKFLNSAHNHAIIEKWNVDHKMKQPVQSP